MKFGGTSVGSIHSILSVKQIVESQHEPVIVVVSALGGITDKLIRTSQMAASGDMAYEKEFQEIVRRHMEMVDAVIPEGTPKEELNLVVSALLNELKDIYQGLYLIKDLSPKTSAAIVSYGERISSRIVATLIDGARWYDSRQFIKTEKKHARRRVKQTVAGVFAYAEHGAIKRGQRRYAVNKPEVTVAAKTGKVQKPGRRHPGARAELRQPPGDQRAPQKGREVPQVVKRSFPHKAAQPCGRAVSGVEIQRQVERRSRQIDEHVVPDEAPEPLPAAAGEEIPADHEKKRNGHPGQNPCQQKISQRGDACKR